MPKCAASARRPRARARRRSVSRTPARGASSSAAKALACTSRGSLARPEIVAAVSIVRARRAGSDDVAELVGDGEALALDRLRAVRPRRSRPSPSRHERAGDLVGQRATTTGSAGALLDERDHARHRRHVVEPEPLARLPRARLAPKLVSSPGMSGHDRPAAAWHQVVRPSSRGSRIEPDSSFWGPTCPRSPAARLSTASRASGCSAPRSPTATCACCYGGMLVSMAGSWAYNVALLAVVYDRTGSLGWVGGGDVGRFIPSLVVQPVRRRARGPVRARARDGGLRTCSPARPRRRSPSRCSPTGPVLADRRPRRRSTAVAPTPYEPAIAAVIAAGRRRGRPGRGELAARRDRERRAGRRPGRRRADARGAAGVVRVRARRRDLRRRRGVIVARMSHAQPARST